MRELNPRIKRLRERLLTSPNSLCIQRARLLTQSMKASEGGDMLIRQGKAIRHILENIPIKIFPDELIVGTMTSRPPGAIFYPELFGLWVMPEIDRLSKRKVNPFMVSKEDISILKEEVAPYWGDKTVYSFGRSLFPKGTEAIVETVAFFILTEVAGISHATVNYPFLLSVGLSDLLKRTESHEGNFYEALSHALRGEIRLAERYAEQAERLAMEEEGERRGELLEIAEICRRVPALPPRNFHEALQFIWFFHLALHQENWGASISIGRMDQFLLPYFRRDLENGRIDYEKAVELIQCLWIKTSELVPIVDSSTTTRFFGGLPTYQAVTIGGVNREGEDATNELSHLILDATDRLRLKEPNLTARLHEGTPDNFREKVSEVIKRGGNILAVFNDEVTIPALCKREVSLEDARDYSITGCVEPTSAGRTFGSTDAALFNLPICLELALNNGRSGILRADIGLPTGDAREFKSMKEIVDAFRRQVAHFVKHMVDGSNCLEQVHQKVKPTPLMSIAIEGCLTTGEDVTLGSAKYNFTGVQAVGIADVADSLAALEKFVFRERRYKIDEFLQKLEMEVKEEPFRLMLWNRGPKYGNDDDDADKYAKLIAKIFEEEVEKYENPRGGRFIPGIYSIGTQCGFGGFVSTLPSGRKARETLAVGISPHQGCDRRGPTATMKSVTKVKHELFANGVSLNMKINPKSLAGEVGTKALSSLIQTYFEMGGMHVNFNAIDRETLLDAQNRPENYQDLLVRVGGFSARFVNLGKEHQDEIIARTEHYAPSSSF